jgi:hypothetical protein
MSLEALTAEERKQLLMSIGTHRGERVLSPVEVARLLRKALDSGISMASCAESVQLTGTSQIARFLALLKLLPDVQHLVDWGRSDVTLAFSAAFELSRLDIQEDQREAASSVLAHGFSTSEVRQLVQMRKRSGKPLDDCVHAVLKMRPQIERRHVFIGSVLREDVRKRLTDLSQQKRDEAIKRVLGQRFGHLKARGRLGTERFTLVGGAELGAAVKVGEALEQQVNRELAGALI